MMYVNERGEYCIDNRSIPPELLRADRRERARKRIENHRRYERMKLAAERALEQSA